MLAIDRSSWKKKLKILVRVAVISLVFLSLIGYLSNISSDYVGLQKITSYIYSTNDNFLSGDSARIDRFRVSIDGFLDSYGLGVGTGGFAHIYGASGKEYPHNIVLEVAVEQGLLGLFTLLVLFGIVRRKINLVYRYEDQDYVVFGQLIASIWFYMLINAFVSSDISGNHGVWVSPSLLWMLPRKQRISSRKKMP